MTYWLWMIGHWFLTACFCCFYNNELRSGRWDSPRNIFCRVTSHTHAYGHTYTHTQTITHTHTDTHTQIRTPESLNWTLITAYFLSLPMPLCQKHRSVYVYKHTNTHTNTTVWQPCRGWGYKAVMATILQGCDWSREWRAEKCLLKRGM